MSSHPVALATTKLLPFPKEGAERSIDLEIESEDLEVQVALISYLLHLL